MRKTISLVSLCGIVAVLLCSSGARAQQKGRPKTDDETVRLGVTLVQIDVVVTDKEGKQVEGLTADNFEVRDSGKKQHLLHCDYVRLGRPAGKTPAPSGLSLTAGERQALQDMGSAVSSKEPRRVIAFLVDDIWIAAPELPRAREVLTDFVDNQMQDGDLVATCKPRGALGCSTSSQPTGQF